MKLVVFKSHALLRAGSLLALSGTWGQEMMPWGERAGMEDISLP